MAGCPLRVLESTRHTASGCLFAAEVFGGAAVGSGGVEGDVGMLPAVTALGAANEG